MIVCVCNAIREIDLRAEARSGGGDAEAIYGRLGHEPQCRQCLDEAAAILDEERCRGLCASRMDWLKRAADPHPPLTGAPFR